MIRNRKVEGNQAKTIKNHLEQDHLDLGLFNSQMKKATINQSFQVIQS